MTHIIDVEKVASILRNHYTRRGFNDAFPSLVEDEVWDISIMRGDEPVRISLGNTNTLFRSASDTIIHRIVSAELLMEELGENMPLIDFPAKIQYTSTEPI